jgi:hypothetical protein
MTGLLHRHCTTDVLVGITQDDSGSRCRSKAWNRGQRTCRFTPYVSLLLASSYQCTFLKTCSSFLQRLLDGRVSIQSEDATVRLVVHPHGKRFAVCFPLLITTDDTLTSPQSKGGAFTYYWQTQLFATVDYPSRWQHPLSLATSALQHPELFDVSTPTCAEVRPEHVTSHAKAAEDSGNRLSSISDVGSPDREIQTIQSIPTVPRSDMEAGDASSAMALVPLAMSSNTAVAPTEAHMPSVMQRTTHLPQAVVARPEGPNFVQDGTWWTECSLEQLPEDVRCS